MSKSALMLARLSRMMIQDILAASDDDILAEVKGDGGDVTATAAAAISTAVRQCPHIARMEERLCRVEERWARLSDIARGMTDPGKPQVSMKTFSAGALRCTLADMEISNRARNTLERSGCKTAADVARMSERELLRLPNFGRISLREVKEVLGLMGLSIGMQFPAISSRACGGADEQG